MVRRNVEPSNLKENFPMEKVIAVIVTYNRSSLLAECIEALRNQTRTLDAILVINNGSTDGTEQWLTGQKDIFCISQKNIGSSGGFNTGINWAYRHGYSWIWCMDDDGYPAPDALEKILEPETEHLCLRNCAVINKIDKKSFVWKTKHYKTIDEAKGNLIYGIGHPFNGTMIHRNIVERVGTPKSALFLWGDETEYYYRITRRNNIPVVTVGDSIHYHPAAAFSYKLDWDYKHSWKIYYYVRNRLYIHQAKFSNRITAFIHYCLFLVAMVGVVLFFQKTDRIKKLEFLIWPVMDAFNHNFNANPQEIIERLNAAHPIHIGKGLLHQVKHIWATFLGLIFVPRTRTTANA